MLFFLLQDALAQVLRSKSNKGLQMNLDFVQANLEQHRKILLDFNVAYINWIGDCIQEYFGLSLPGLLGMSIPDYADSSLNKLLSLIHI